MENSHENIVYTRYSNSCAQLYNSDVKGFQTRLDNRSHTRAQAPTRVCIIAYSVRACVRVFVILSIMYSRFWSEWKRKETGREEERKERSINKSIYTYDSICNCVRLFIVKTGFKIKNYSSHIGPLHVSFQTCQK